MFPPQQLQAPARIGADRALLRKHWRRNAALVNQKPIFVFSFCETPIAHACLPDVKIIQQDQPNDDKNARRAACAAGPPKVVHHLSSLRNPKNTKIVFRLTLGGSVDDNDRVRSGCGHGR